MKIIFLCGSMEPGRDGVGDYIRRLAGALNQQGHEVGVLAFNDRNTQSISEADQYEDGIAIYVMRLPEIMPIKERMVISRKWIDAFDPEWISLQFVPFAFHPKGLAFGLSKHLNTIGKSRKWHIMFHELWVGMDKESGTKFAWWGWLQQKLIRSITLKLQPIIIHTQTRLYQSQLSKMGFKAQYLPLCSNIPNTSAMSIAEASNTEGKEVFKNISFVIFGGVHPKAPVAAFAREASALANEQNIQITLTIVGRCGAEQNRWADTWKAAGLTAELLGEQPTQRISEILSMATIGISTTPIELAEKSGSVAAMQSHGLPVICVSHPWEPRNMPKPAVPSGVVEYQEGNLKACILLKPAFPYNNTLQEVSDILSKSLLAAS